MDITTFIGEYYINPILQGTGYNIVNTFTYAAILILSVFLLLKVFDRLDIEMNRSLWINLIPFVFLGGALRALEDIGFFSFLGNWHYVFVTPLIYLLVFAIAFIPLIVIEKLDLDRKYLGLLGLFLLGVASGIAASQAHRIAFFSLIIITAISGCLLTYLILTRIGLERFKNIMNWSPIFAHSLDASATVVAISMVGGYTEQHVLPSMIFKAVPVFFFIPIKLSLAAAAIYFLDKELEGRWAWILKFTVLVLGMGPGTRNALTILIGG